MLGNFRTAPATPRRTTAGWPGARAAAGAGRADRGGPRAFHCARPRPRQCACLCALAAPSSVDVFGRNGSWRAMLGSIPTRVPFARPPARARSWYRSPAPPGQGALPWRDSVALSGALLGVRRHRRWGVQLLRSRHLQGARQNAGLSVRRLAHRGGSPRSGHRGRRLVRGVSPSARPDPRRVPRRAGARPLRCACSQT